MAQETLVRQFEKPVFNAAYRMLGNVDDAADVTQTAFLKVFENIGSFDARFRVYSWIYRIALNEAIDQIKRRRPTEPFGDSRSRSTDVPYENVARRELCDEVQATLMELKEDYRAVIVLRYFTECSYREIGEILHLPEKTVKSRLFSARQQLRTQLQQHGILSS